MRATYTGRVISEGGRHGHVTSSDGILDLDLALVDGLGKADQRVGTNPEQLFGGAYAACFETSILAVAKSLHIKVEKSSVTAYVSLYKDKDGFYLGVDLEVSLPDLGETVARELIEKAHAVCPYSKAVANNITVNIILV